MSYAKDEKTGRLRELQAPDPSYSRDGDDPDCAFCESKSRCVRQGRLFFVGEKYPVCRLYVDYRKNLEEEQKRAEGLIELKKITVPVPRQDGAAPDCLYCKLLNVPQNCRGGPFQGEGKTCGRYNEVNVRPAGEPKHCLYCLKNFYCEQGRVLRDGEPCERYHEYEGGK